MCSSSEDDAAVNYDEAALTRSERLIGRVTENVFFAVITITTKGEGKVIFFECSCRFVEAVE